MQEIKKLIFNLQRFQILQTKLNHQTSNYLPDSYVYAWYEEIFPIIHSGDLHEDLKGQFKITKEQVNLISKYADDEWLEGRLYNFYEYEKYFQTRQQNEYGIERHTLIAVFKYFHLANTFDSKFWEKLLEPMNHPVEAQSIVSKFDEDSIYLI